MSGFAAMLIKISGWLDILFGVAYLSYWFVLPRRNLLQKVGAGITRQLDTTNVQIAAFFIGIGIILLLFSDDIASLKMGRAVLVLAAIMWIIRALFQHYDNGADDQFAHGSRIWPNRVLMGLFIVVSVLHVLPVIFG